MSNEVLKEATLSAAKQTLSQARDKISGEICGFGLYVDSDLKYVSPAINTSDHLLAMCSKYPGEVENFRWTRGEWSHELFGVGNFSNANSLISDLHLSGMEFSKIRAAVSASCLKALLEIRREGAMPDACVMIFSIDDSKNFKEEIEWIELLNPPAQASEFSVWLRSIM